MKPSKILPGLVCGFGAAALTVIPGFKGPATCCLLLPTAAVFSLILHQRINKAEPPFKAGTAVLLGFLTGIFAAVFSSMFDILLTFITHTNEFIEALPETESMMRDLNMGPMYQEAINMLKYMAHDIETYGFSVFYTIAVFFSNFIIDSIFGIIGGLIGLLFINRKAARL